MINAFGRHILGDTIRWGLVSIAAVLFLAPLIWLASAAFKPENEIFTIPVRLWSNHFSLQSFSRSLTKWNIGQSFINSGIITIGSVLFQLLVSSLCAFALATMRFKGRQAIFYLILATMMLPGFTMIVPSYRVAAVLRLVNSFGGLIIPAGASAFGVFMLRQYFIKIPVDFFEAAVLDGAGQLKIWWSVTLPLARPALAALSIFSFLGVWKDFLWPVLILQKEELFTLSIKMWFMNSYIGKDYGAIIATSFIAAIVPVILFLLFQRQFIEGMTGGLKG
ncbi:MAG: carbohydrate ABC transporter permease [Firmicutes bacterium]|nr:carbohydrate ABC transporter permease [Bacillota bacterium]